jgi:hypothetical protein
MYVQSQEHVQTLYNPHDFNIRTYGVSILTARKLKSSGPGAEIAIRWGWKIAI